MLRSIALAILLTIGAAQVSAQQSATAESSPSYEELAFGASYFSDGHGDWRLRCRKTENATDPCQLHQFLYNAAGSTVAQFVVYDLPPGDSAAVVGATVTVPLETSLTEQLKIQIDDHPVKIYPFAYCNKIGCHARIGFTPVELQWLKQGSRALLATVPYRDQGNPVVLPLSLSGFTAGYKAVLDNNSQ